MPNPVNARYKMFDGTNWVLYYFETSASQVGTTASRKFLTTSVTVNNVPFVLGGAGSETANVTIDGSDIGCGISQNLNYIDTTESVAEALAGLDSACKSAYDHVPSDCLTVTNYAPTLDSVYLKPTSSLNAANLTGTVPTGCIPSNVLTNTNYAATLDGVYLRPTSTLDATKLSGLIPTDCLPDYVLGQVLYGGTLGANAVASLTPNAKSKLGTNLNSISLLDSSITDNFAGACWKNEGIYYIVETAQTFDGLELQVGDWLLSNGTTWEKIDNTDAVRTVKGINQVNDSNVSGIGNVVLSAADVNAVALTGNSTISGIKTFTGSQYSSYLTFSNPSGVTPAIKFNIDGDGSGNGVESETGVSGGIQLISSFFNPASGNTYHAGLSMYVGASNKPGNIYLNATGGHVYIGQTTYGTLDPNKVVATIGDVNTALGSYVTTSAFNTALAGKVDKVTGSQLIETTKITAYDNHLANTSNPHSVTKAQVGLGNVENKSVATIKSELTGSIAQDNTGFVTGGAVNTALANKLDSVPDFRKYYGNNYAWYVGYDTWRGVKYYFTGDDEEHPDFCGFIGMDTNEFGTEIIIQAVDGVVITSTNDIQDRTGAVLKTTNLTDKRTVQFPDRDGTIALAPTVGTTQPSSAVAGDIWIDTN